MSGPRRRRRLLLAAAAVALACTWAYDVAHTPGPIWPAPATVRAVGSWHVHGHDSHDSRVPPEAWAEAAAARGLNFVVLTDHDSQRRTPWVHAGVLLLPQAELSTVAGHLIGLGSPVVPLPAERHDPDVVAHLAARKVAAVAAHPKSPKRPWTGGPAHLAGVEPANLSAAFDRALRDPMSWTRLLGLAVWPLNPPLALAQLIDRDAEALALWDTLLPPALGPCGVDGHGWLDLGLNLSAWHLVLEDVAAPGANGAADAAPAALPLGGGQLLAALRSGHFHSVVGLWQREVGFQFGAYDGEGAVLARGGETLPAGRGHLRTCVGEGAAGTLQLRLLRDGREVARTQARCLTLPKPGAGAWRVEGWSKLPSPWGRPREVPVLYSNRITVQAVDFASAPDPAPAPVPAPGR